MKLVILKLMYTHVHMYIIGVDPEVQKEGAKFCRECNLAPYPQHMNILGVISQYHSKEGYLQKTLKRGSAAPSPLIKSAHCSYRILRNKLSGDGDGDAKCTTLPHPPSLESATYPSAWLQLSRGRTGSLRFVQNNLSALLRLFPG